MSPQKQTRINPNGDCLRACLASLLEIPIATVPDFITEEGTDETGYPNWSKVMQDFLAEWGLQLIEIQLVPSLPWIKLLHDVHVIFLGERKSGAKHAVVGKLSGVEFVQLFDPIEGSIDGIENVEAVLYLVPMDISRHVRKESALLEILETSKAVSNPAIRQAIKNSCLDGLGREDEEKPLIFIPDGNS